MVNYLITYDYDNRELNSNPKESASVKRRLGKEHYIKGQVSQNYR